MKDRDGRAQMRFGGVPERRDERMTIQGPLDDTSLNAAAASVDQTNFAPAGLAYDSVSQRFVVGDLHGRKLMVVTNGADHAIDLVRDDSAGFRNIEAMVIDDRRGDIRVAYSVGYPERLEPIRLGSKQGLVGAAIASDATLARNDGT